MVEEQQNSAEGSGADIWILCYGSNGPRQLCERIGTPYESIVKRMCAVKVHGYKRGFCNTGGRWENKSVATLWQTGNDNDIVEGVALRMTQAEVSALDPFEGYPSWYNRETMTLEAYMEPSGGSTGESVERVWTNIEGQAYI